MLTVSVHAPPACISVCCRRILRNLNPINWFKDEGIEMGKKKLVGVFGCRQVRVGTVASVSPKATTGRVVAAVAQTMRRVFLSHPWAYSCWKSAAAHISVALLLVRRACHSLMPFNTFSKETACAYLCRILIL